MRRTAFASVFAVAITSTALAADLPPRPAYKAAPAYVAYNWTGFYVGGHIGYGWSTLTGTDTTFGTTDSGKLKGILGGVQLGYNYQIGSFVLGVEGEYSFADVKFTMDDPLGIGAGGKAEIKNDYFATIAGRLGYAFDRVLIYAKGGGAFTRDKLDINDGIGGTATGNFSRSGWVAGAGLEYALWDRWSVKLEYNYMSFGAVNELPTTSGGLTSTAANVSAKTNIIKGGVNYRFF
jgi:outer membrane immunogenic protein